MEMYSTSITRTTTHNKLEILNIIAKNYGLIIRLFLRAGRVISFPATFAMKAYSSETYTTIQSIIIEIWFSTSMLHAKNLTRKSVMYFPKIKRKAKKMKVNHSKISQ